MTDVILLFLEHDFFRKPVPVPHRVRGRLFRNHVLTDADARRRNEYPHLAPEKFKQDRDATIVGDAFEDAFGVGENAVHEPDTASRTDAGRKPQYHEAVAVLARADIVDDAFGSGNGSSPASTSRSTPKVE